MTSWLVGEGMSFGDSGCFGPPRERPFIRTVAPGTQVMQSAVHFPPGIRCDYRTPGGRRVVATDRAWGLWVYWIIGGAIIVILGGGELLLRIGLSGAR